MTVLCNATKHPSVRGFKAFSDKINLTNLHNIYREKYTTVLDGKGLLELEIDAKRYVFVFITRMQNTCTIKITSFENVGKSRHCKPTV